MDLLIKNVQLNGSPTDVWIEGNRFKSIGPGLTARADQVIDGEGKAILPSFVNQDDMYRTGFKPLSSWNGLNVIKLAQYRCEGKQA